MPSSPWSTRGPPTGEGRAARDRYQVVLHLEATPDDAPALRVHQGPPLPDSVRRFLLCDTSVRTVSEIGGWR